MRPVAKPVVFLDDGGVMNLNHVRGPQWQRLVGEYMAPLLGGTREAWSAANIAVVEQELVHMWTNPEPRWTDYKAREARAWLLGMCRRVGVAPPPDAELVALHERATAWIVPQVRSAAPGAVDAIRALRARGYRLMTASGEDSLQLNGYLTGMGVRECFERLYGPDLIDTTKHGPLYYRRVFEDAGVRPQDAWVVDDSRSAVAWARGVGARAVHVGDDVPDLAAVPALLESRETL